MKSQYKTIKNDKKKKKKTKNEKKKNETLSTFLVIFLVCEQMQGPLIKNLHLYDDFIILDDTLINSVTSQSDSLLGQSGIYKGAGLKFVRWKSNISWTSSKLRNRKIKSDNGNRNNQSNLSVIHWNGGAKKWSNKKLEIESLLQEKSPDLCFISEANIWDDLEANEIDLEGYNTYLPNTMKSLHHSRIVLLAKNDLTLKIIPEKTQQ